MGSGVTAEPYDFTGKFLEGFGQMTVSRLVGGSARVLTLVAGLLVGVLPALAAEKSKGIVEVTGVRLGEHTETTRLVLDLNGAVQFSTSTLSGPNRVVLELPGVTWDPKTVSSARGLVAKVGYDTLKGGSGRVVIELKKPATIKSTSLLKPQDGKSYRLVVDLAPISEQAFLAKAKGAAPAAKVAEVAPPPPVDKEKVAAAPPSVVKPAAPPSPLTKPAAPAPQTMAAAPTAPAKFKLAEKALDKIPQRVPESIAEMAPVAIVEKPPTASPLTAAVANLPARPVPLTSVKIPSAKAPPVASSPLTGPPVTAKPTVPVATASVAPLPGTAPRIATVTPGPAPKSPAAPQVAPLTKNGKRVVVIDPGHGGADPGAQGTDGTLEKDVVLATALALGAELTATGRYDVVYTRLDDTFLKLGERVSVARDGGASLFISLHADALAGDPHVGGLSVYTLSEKASDAQAARLAQKENRADIIGGVNLKDEPDDVMMILIDLAQRQTLDHSVKFARSVVGDLDKEARLTKNAHRSAGFKVLKALDVPSVLIELGYLSNADDLANLTSPDWRGKVATGLAGAVDEYFRGLGEDPVRRAEAPLGQ